MKRLACLVACVAIAGAAAQIPAAPPLPTVTSVTLPVVPEIYRTAKVAGAFKVLVTTDGRQVTDVHDVAIERQEVHNSPLLSQVVAPAVRAWRFAPHVAQSFELTVRAVPRQDPDACYDSNWRVKLHLPTEVAFEYPPSCIIDAAVTPVPGTMTVRQLRGVVRDEAGAALLGDVHVALHTQDDFRSVSTDDAGRFDFGLVRPGKYAMSAGGTNYGHRSYTVVVNPGVSSLVPLEFRLHRYADHQSLPIARASEVALYPLAMRDANVSGDVRLEVNAGGDATLLDGPPGLADTALSNLKTWRWERLKRGITVTYHYRLLAGDCTGDNGPFVTAQYPSDVDVAMKRVVPCGPGR